MQGAHGEDKIPWSISFDISEANYNAFMSYGYGKNGILYNAVETDEYKSLCFHTSNIALGILIDEINGTK